MQPVPLYNPIQLNLYWYVAFVRGLARGVSVVQGAVTCMAMSAAMHSGITLSECASRKK
jgi:hypothetical protein